MSKGAFVLMEREACMRVSRKSGHSGVTLIEVVIAMALLAVVIVGSYACGITVIKMRLYNSITSESRALGIQKLEEVAAVGFDNIVQQVPYAPQTNNLAGKYPVVRKVEVNGHTANRTVEPILTNSAYLEVHVLMSYYSPFSYRAITDSYSTLVRK